jgi:hypothetical protein
MLYPEDAGKIVFLYKMEVMAKREEGFERLSLCLSLTLVSAVDDTEDTGLISSPACSSVSFRSSFPIL